jgi:hypothetical protein
MTSDFIKSIHIQILNLNKNYYNENSTVDLTNSNLINSNSLLKLKPKKNNNFQSKYQIKKRILKEEVLNESINDSKPIKKINGERLDAKGIPINKNKKHKITFIDEIDNKTPLVEVQRIESFKQYNSLNSYHINEQMFNGKSHCNCSCYII